MSDFLEHSPHTASLAPRTQPNRRRSWRQGVLALAGLIGTIGSFGMFAAIDNWQSHVAELRFANLASDHLETINFGLQDATDLLYGLRAYFEAHQQDVSQIEFQAFSRALRDRVPGLRDTGWAPRVLAGDRDRFERDVRASGHPDFQINERNAEGKLVRAADRPEYYPILYSDPDVPNRPVMGFDVASEPLRNRTIARALMTNQPAATPPVKLMNLARPNGGMMSFIPVSPKNPASDGEPSPVTGVVLGAFETAKMIENILGTKVRLVGLDMYVFDPDGHPGNRLIYWHATHGTPPPDEASLLAGRHWQGTLELVDQRWGVILTPSDRTVAPDIDRTAIETLVSGLMMTALLVAYLWHSHRRTLQLEQLTAELHETGEELRRNSAKLDHLARHDVLTGLANRKAFRDDLMAYLAREGSFQALAVLYLDLDRFKAVNDTMGHPVGDRLLCEVANRLRASVRGADIITRLGGDEFAIAQLDGDQPAAAESLAARLIATLSQPYKIDGHWVVVGASAGIALVERDDIDIDALLRRADMALYAAKRQGRGTWRRFTEAMEHDGQTQRGMEKDLRDALEHQELEVYYQPCIRLADRAICGLEVLLRWHHPDRGLVLPGDFIRCAEETGLILPVGAWVLRTALAQAASWPDHIRLAVNLSPRQLADQDLVETIEAALAASGQTASRLELEITASTLIAHDGTGQTVLQRLRALGMRIALDDFGADDASLRHLREFPFDRIKINRPLVAGMTESPQGSAIVLGILQRAATSNIATVAQGIETQAQLDQLTAFGCQQGQGFLFSPAQPASALPSLFKDWAATGELVAASAQG